MEAESSTREARFHARFIEAGFPWLFERTVAIFTIADRGNPRPWGSAILLRIADAGFLVSARHVLNVPDDLGLLAAPFALCDSFVSVDGVDAALTRDERLADLAFIRLRSGIDHALSAHKTFLRLSDLDLASSPSGGRYAVYGFPQELARVEAESNARSLTPFCYTTDLYSRELDEYEVGTTIALDFPARTANV